MGKVSYRRVPQQPEWGMSKAGCWHYVREPKPVDIAVATALCGATVYPLSDIHEGHAPLPVMRATTNASSPKCSKCVNTVRTVLFNSN